MLITDINKKELAVSTAIPLVIGGMASLINLEGFKEFGMMEKPSITPPMFVFPIVWTVLYILMGFSAYLVYRSDSEFRARAFAFYCLQLAANFLWTCFFFGAKDYISALVTVLIMAALIAGMIFYFYKVNKKSAYFQIPYLIWTVFAAYLNYLVCIMNKK